MAKLNKSVGQIANTLERFANVLPITGGSIDSMFLLSAKQGQPDSIVDAANLPDPSKTLTRSIGPRLPDPRLVRKIIRQRQMRARFFGGDLFADPAWDMLLELTAAKAENTRISVTSLCIASGVPSTTALRWISEMTKAGLFVRFADESDRRRSFIGITDMAANAMKQYFAELGDTAASAV